jgi:hypothetical protein
MKEKGREGAEGDCMGQRHGAAAGSGCGSLQRPGKHTFERLKAARLLWRGVLTGEKQAQRELLDHVLLLLRHPGPLSGAQRLAPAAAHRVLGNHGCEDADGLCMRACVHACRWRSAWELPPERMHAQCQPALCRTVCLAGGGMRLIWCIWGVKLGIHTQLAS